jgi:hypothetical protein
MEKIETLGSIRWATENRDPPNICITVYGVVLTHRRYYIRPNTPAPCCELVTFWGLSYRHVSSLEWISEVKWSVLGWTGVPKTGRVMLHGLLLILSCFKNIGNRFIRTLHQLPLTFCQNASWPVMNTSFIYFYLFFSTTIYCLCKVLGNLKSTEWCSRVHQKVRAYLLLG